MLIMPLNIHAFDTYGYPGTFIARQFLSEHTYNEFPYRNWILVGLLQRYPGIWQEIRLNVDYSTKLHCPLTQKSTVPIYTAFEISCNLFWHQYRAFCIIYNLTNDCTIISNTVITNNMLLHVSTFKISSSGSSLCLAKITHRFFCFSKIKLLKYKMINFNKMLIVQRDNRFA